MPANDGGGGGQHQQQALNAGGGAAAAAGGQQQQQQQQQQKRHRARLPPARSSGRGADGGSSAGRGAAAAAGGRGSAARPGTSRSTRPGRRAPPSANNGPNATSSGGAGSTGTTSTCTSGGTSSSGAGRQRSAGPAASGQQQQQQQQQQPANNRSRPSSRSSNPDGGSAGGSSSGGGGGGGGERSTGSAASGQSRRRPGAQQQGGQQAQRRPGRGGRGRGAGGRGGQAPSQRRPQQQQQQQQQQAGQGQPSPNRNPSQRPQQRSGSGAPQRGPSRRPPPPNSGDGFANEGGSGPRGGASTNGDRRRPPSNARPSSRIGPSSATGGPRMSSRNANRPSDPARDPGRLYAMLEAGLPKGEGAPEGGGGGGGGGSGSGTQPPLTRLEELRRAERLARTYDAVREWIVANPDPAVRREAATFLGTFGVTPLHMLCKLPDPPVDIVADLMDCAPETVKWAESSGWLPLHLAVASGASLAVLALLSDADPDSKVAQDRRLRTPLHFAFYRDDVKADGKNKSRGGGIGGDGTLEGAAQAVVDRGYDSDWDDLDGGTGDDADIVALLCDTGAALQHDENGMLPLHYASAYGTSAGVLDVLLEAYPNSIKVREKNGRTPLHLAMVNAHRPASPAVIRHLLSVPDSDIVNMTDKEGHLPLHLLANIATRFKPDQKEAHTYATESLKLYLAAGPKASSEFLTAVQRLPDWLRDHAVVSPHVQSILNVKIAKRFPMSILLLDGYVLIMLIVCFEISSNYAIDLIFQEEGDPPVEPYRGPGFVYAVIAGGGYFFIREVIQALALVNMGSFKSWLFSASNWLDMFMMALVLSMGAAMINYDIMSKELFRDLAALTKGILWVSFILYVKSTLVDFAVFVGGVQYVLRRLAAFLVALACILMAFAFMFYYIFSMTPFCAVDEEGRYAFPHCSITDSLLRVYTMMMGEVDDTLYQTTISQILYVLYAFLVIILLSNVLIAIVTDSYGIIKNERAAMVFWSNRLNFIAEVDAIAAVRKQLLGEGHLLPRPYATDDSEPYGSEGGGDGAQGKSRSKKVFRDLWKSMTGLFQENPYEYMDVSPGSFDFWCYLLLRIAAIFIIPAWIFLGLLTAGWLWPPQVRERLLCQTAVKISRADIAEKARKEVSKLRHELRNLKKGVMLEKKNDRRELTKMKAEVEDLQRDVMSDLTQVKEIMTTLLDLEREKAQK